MKIILANDENLTVVRGGGRIRGGTEEGCYTR